MLDFISNLWQAFIPPLHASAEAQYNWRIRVGIFSCVAFSGLCFLAAASYGLVPHVSGFETTYASDVQSAAIIREIRDNRAEQIENELLNLRIKHCAAIKSNNDEGKILYWSKISDRMIRYQQLTGRVYALPQCSDL